MLCLSDGSLAAAFSLQIDMTWLMAAKVASDLIIGGCWKMGRGWVWMNEPFAARLDVCKVQNPDRSVGFDWRLHVDKWGPSQFIQNFHAPCHGNCEPGPYPHHSPSLKAMAQKSPQKPWCFWRKSPGKLSPQTWKLGSRPFHIWTRWG